MSKFYVYDIYSSLAETKERRFQLAQLIPHLKIVCQYSKVMVNNLKKFEHVWNIIYYFFIIYTVFVSSDIIIISLSLKQSKLYPQNVPDRQLYNFGHLRTFERFPCRYLISLYLICKNISNQYLLLILYLGIINILCVINKISLHL